MLEQLPAMSPSLSSIDNIDYSAGTGFGCEGRFLSPISLGFAISHICLDPAIYLRYENFVYGLVCDSLPRVYDKCIQPFIFSRDSLSVLMH